MGFLSKRYAKIFSGVLIALCIAVSAYLVYTHQKKTEENTVFNNPLVNDLYIVNYKKLFSDFDPEYKYGVMKITRIHKGEIDFIVSTTSYQKISSVKRDIRVKSIEKTDYFDNKPLHIKIKQLRELRVFGTIISVRRYPLKTNS